ncbi:MAG: hypothetical protein WKG07_05195 [Hymenobacter sp.]
MPTGSAWTASDDKTLGNLRELLQDLSKYPGANQPQLAELRGARARVQKQRSHPRNNGFLSAHRPLRHRPGFPVEGRVRRGRPRRRCPFRGCARPDGGRAGR